MEFDGKCDDMAFLREFTALLFLLDSTARRNRNSPSPSMMTDLLVSVYHDSYLPGRLSLLRCSRRCRVRVRLFMSFDDVGMCGLGVVIGEVAISSELCYLHHCTPVA
jgi:hypothetical protein